MRFMPLEDGTQIRISRGEGQRNPTIIKSPTEEIDSVHISSLQPSIFQDYQRSYKPIENQIDTPCKARMKKRASCDLKGAFGQE